MFILNTDNESRVGECSLGIVVCRVYLNKYCDMMSIRGVRGESDGWGMCMSGKGLKAN